jgi:hypothetical protein
MQTQLHAQRLGIGSRTPACARAARRSRVVAPVRAAAETMTPGSATSDGTDLGSKMNTVKICVFSAKPYVLDFMSEPLSVFPNTTFTDVSVPCAQAL